MTKKGHITFSWQHTVKERLDKTTATWNPCHTLLRQWIVDSKEVLIVVKDVGGHLEGIASLVYHGGRCIDWQCDVVVCLVTYWLVVTHNKGHKVGAHGLAHLKLVHQLSQWNKEINETEPHYIRASTCFMSWPYLERTHSSITLNCLERTHYLDTVIKTDTY